MLIQQGDVLIQSCTIPLSAKKIETDRIVLAEGETTGHAHVIVDDNVQQFEHNNQMYIRVLRETVANHEEHNTVTIPVGDYIVSKVREYDHFLEESRSVRD